MPNKIILLNLKDYKFEQFSEFALELLNYTNIEIIIDFIFCCMCP
jgi:hypothetical protein